jgi:hypothetical protein
MTRPTRVGVLVRDRSRLLRLRPGMRDAVTRQRQAGDDRISSCDALRACYNAPATIGDDACNTVQICEGKKGRVKDGGP